MKKQCTKDINVFHILEPSCKTLWRNVTEKAEMHRLMLESDGVGVPLHFKCRVIQQKQKENICTVAFIPIDVYAFISRPTDLCFLAARLLSAVIYMDK
jgi:hypothetical protein